MGANSLRSAGATTALMIPLLTITVAFMQLRRTVANTETTKVQDIMERNIFEKKTICVAKDLQTFIDTVNAFIFGISANNSILNSRHS